MKKVIIIGSGIGGQSNISRKLTAYSKAYDCQLEKSIRHHNDLLFEDEIKLVS